MEKSRIIKNWLLPNRRSIYFIKYKITGVLMPVILFFTNNIFSQINLVPNGSFEFFSSCPTTGYGEIYKATPWFQPNAPSSSGSSGSSDYFNFCAGFNCNNLSQCPRTGSGIAGIAFFFDTASFNIDKWREYIEVGLTDSLKKDKKYCVRYYVNKVNNPGMSCYPIKQLQAVLTNDSLLYNDPNYSYITGVTPIMEADSIITDTINWTPIQTTYIAHGGERFITIGNFSPGNQVNYLVVGNPNAPDNTFGYYYIDDVSVILCDTTPTNIGSLTVPNAFSPNNDGHNDLFKLQGWKNSVTEFTIIIYDRWGEKVFESNDPEKTWDGTYKGKSMDAGVFVYFINATAISGEKIIRKGNISLIR